MPPSPPCWQRLEEALADAGCAPGGSAAFLVVAEEMVTNVARYAWPAGAVPGIFNVSAADHAGVTMASRWNS